MRRRRVLIGVTIDDSLQFHEGLPAVLVADGWEVHVVSGPGRRNERLRGAEHIFVHVIPMSRAPAPWRDTVALWRWIRLLRQIRPDATLIGTPKAALLGTVAGRIVGVPFRIHELLGLRLETATGSSRRILLEAERLTARSAHRVLAVGDSLRGLAVEMGIADADKVVVLGAGSCNGVDLERFGERPDSAHRREELSREIGLDPRVPTIGFVGRLTSDKGLTQLAAAMATLAARGLRVQLLIVGSIDDDTGHGTLAGLRATGQPVVEVGYRSDTEHFYPLMTALCLPSLREGLPNVILEAMASRTLVIGTDATGIVDLIDDRHTGYLVPRGASEELASAIESAIVETEANERIVDAAFAMVSARFEESTVQNSLRDFLRTGSDSR